MADSMTGGEAMVRAAQANGIDTIYGVPGAQIYPLFDAMARLGIRVIHTRHEQAAAYMAMGHAKSTGRPAAFAVVPGPGVLNTTAALCTAMGTCAPVLCLTGQVPSQFLGVGRGHLHEIADQTGTLRTLIKDAFHIADPAQTGAIMRDAFTTMNSGRPGPVAVEMCWDTMAATHDVDLSGCNGVTEKPALSQTEIEAAAELVRGAKRPLIMCGAGAQHASAEVCALAETLHAPVTAFRSGRGVVSEDHPLGTSSLAARALMEDTDLVIGIGSRLEMIYMRWRSMMHYEQRPKGPKLIRIDIDPNEFERLTPDVAVLADSADAARALTEAITENEAPDPDARTRIDQAKSRAATAAGGVTPHIDYLRVIREALPRDGFFVPELSQIGFASYFGFPVYEPRTYVSEGFQGTLGYGFQTALGVKAAHPDRAVISVNGDGGFMFGVQELATAVAHRLGVVAVVFNNAAYGNVKRDQQTNFGGRIVGSELGNPDFVALAQSFGAAGHRLHSPGELSEALPEALASDLPTLIEVPLPLAEETPPWPFIHMPEVPWS